MDIATIIGMAGTLGCIAFAVLIGGSVGMFINVPSILIVFGGTVAVTIMKYPMAHSTNAVSIGLKSLFLRPEAEVDLINKGIELLKICRKDGVLGLENEKVDNPYLQKGIQLVVDGHDPGYVRRILSNEMKLMIERHELGQHLYKGIGDAAPAMGMIGTLIGLVQMMSNMSDPKSIGPAMAVALLTTLYGAILANALALPIADKLEIRSKEEKRKKALILEIVNAMSEGQSPAILEEMLVTFLPATVRSKLFPEQR